MNESQQITNYLNELRTVISNLPLHKIHRIIDLLYDAYQRDKQIFIMGNGGSAATASHFMIDLSKQTLIPEAKRFRVIALTDNVPSMTAWANDSCYEDIFVEQLKNLYTPDSLVIGISASGNSENVLRAIRFAKEHGLVTIGFTGFSGGKLKDLVDEVTIVPSNIIGQIEDIHLCLVHLICNVLRDKIKELQHAKKDSHGK